MEKNEGEEGLICQDKVDGGFVKLIDQYEPWVWETATWSGNHWSYEGDRVHLSHLEPVLESNPLFEKLSRE